MKNSVLPTLHRRHKLIFFLIVASVMALYQADAGTPSVSELQATPTPTAPPKTIWTQDYLLGDWGGSRGNFASKGITFSAEYINEIFGNASGGTHLDSNGSPKRGVVYDGLFHFTTELDPAKLTDGAWKGALFHTNFYWIHGSSLSRDYVGDISTISNIDAFDTVRLAECWFQQRLCGDRLSFKIGQNQSDLEFYTSDYANLFLDGTFGAYTFVANNLPSPPAYPMNSPYLGLTYQIDDQISLKVGLFSGSNQGEAVNNHTVAYPLSTRQGLLSFYELCYRLNQSEKDLGLAGTYKVGAWHHTSNPGTVDFDTGQPTAGGTEGVYTTVDQFLWQSSSSKSGARQGLAWFTRIGVAPEASNLVSVYTDDGFNYFGLIPGRDRDICGVAVARSEISSAASRASVTSGGGRMDSETIFEATYQISLAPWWTLQPDFQYVFQPGTLVGSADATVFGVRSDIHF